MRIENTFGIEAQARALITYESEEALREALTLILKQYPNLPLLHIGCGSNLLFLSDYPGVVLKSEIKGIDLKEETADEVLVEVGSGEICDDFIAQAIQNGWYGMENLSLIPGQIGAAAVQNIGAYGVEACDVIEEVHGICLADGTVHHWKNAECGYGYRRSVFKEELWGKYAITRVTIDIRRAKLPDPAVQGNAGSFFKNPVVSSQKAGQLLKEYPDMPHYPTSEGVKLAAGWLIEQAGWKGKSLGPAAVHDRQALVLVNKGGATGRDILRLCEAIQKDVSDKFGIKLEPEVNFI